MKTTLRPLAGAFKLLFIVLSVYWWIAVPAIKMFLYIKVGRGYAESVALSLYMLQPMEVLILSPENIPANAFSHATYYIGPALELIAFSMAFMAAYFFRKTTTGGHVLVLYAILLCIVMIAATLIRSTWTGGVFPFLAAISGIAVGRIAKQISKKKGAI